MFLVKRSDGYYLQVIRLEDTVYKDCLPDLRFKYKQDATKFPTLTDALNGIDLVYNAYPQWANSYQYDVEDIRQESREKIISQILIEANKIISVPLGLKPDDKEINRVALNLAVIVRAGRELGIKELQEKK